MARKVMLNAVILEDSRLVLYYRGERESGVSYLEVDAGEVSPEIGGEALRTIIELANKNARTGGIPSLGFSSLVPSIHLRMVTQRVRKRSSLALLSENLMAGKFLTTSLPVDVNSFSLVCSAMA